MLTGLVASNLVGALAMVTVRDQVGAFSTSLAARAQPPSLSTRGSVNTPKSSASPAGKAFAPRKKGGGYLAKWGHLRRVLGEVADGLHFLNRELGTYLGR